MAAVFPTNTEKSRDFSRLFCAKEVKTMELKPGRYRHFKGKEYRLIGIAKHSETLEPMVVYEPLYGQGGLWVRPAAMWSQTVERDGYVGPRFQWIGE